jgi:hypothetical protein
VANVSTTVQVAGLKETINSLRKIDPQLQKDFKAEATRIAQPAINAGKAAYKQLPLANMGRTWNDRGRKIFPFSVSAAQAGVKASFDTRRNAVGVILIIQKNPAAAVFEVAGRKNSNPLSRSLDFVSTERGFAIGQPGRTRIIGPAVYKARRDIEGEMEKMILRTINEIQGQVNL